MQFAPASAPHHGARTARRLNCRRHDGRGIVDLHQNALDAALAAFSNTIEAAPNSAIAYNNRASVYEK